MGHRQQAEFERTLGYLEADDVRLRLHQLRQNQGTSEGPLQNPRVSADKVPILCQACTEACTMQPVIYWTGSSMTTIMREEGNRTQCSPSARMFHCTRRKGDCPDVSSIASLIVVLGAFKSGNAFDMATRCVSPNPLLTLSC